MPLDLSIVVPMRNERGNVRSLVAEVRDALAGRVFELVVVDDGSVDGTLEELLASRRELLPALRIVRHLAPAGQSAALRSGVEAARHPWVATMDGDGQDDPAEIPRLAACLEGAERPPRLVMVASVRARRQDNWLRRFSSQVANRVRGAVLGDGMRDSASGLRVISRAVFLRLPYFDHMHRFLPALVQRDGGQVAVVEVGHRPRRHGRSKYGIGNRLWVGIVDLLGVLWLQRRASTPEVVEVGEEEEEAEG